jgi:hypothetical protein
MCNLPTGVQKAKPISNKGISFCSFALPLSLRPNSNIGFLEFKVKQDPMEIRWLDLIRNYLLF